MPGVKVKLSHIYEILLFDICPVPLLPAAAEPCGQLIMLLKHSGS